MRPAGPVRPRWAQLTYTSYDEGTGSGGWKVKQSRGDLDEDETAYLRSRVGTTFDAPGGIPTFPTPEEIRVLPRRLVYVCESPARAGYWHTVPAGADATGRPGNVFAHMLLDRSPETADDPQRPIELWRSPEWLTPFGSDQVRAAVLGSPDRPTPRPGLTRRRVLDHLLDPQEWRLGVLSAVLDAVAGALARRWRVVLGAPTPDIGALWLGAVSYLTSPLAARRLSFSTFERGSRLDAAWGRGIQVAVVPTVDLAGLEPEPGTVLLDVDADVQLGDLGGEPHVTAAGSRIAVTEWSALAQVVLQDLGVAEKALTGMDEQLALLGAEVPVGALAWPLATAVLADPHHFADGTTEATHVLTATPAPPGLAASRVRAMRAEAFAQQLGTSTETAWAATLAAPDPESQVMTTRIYLERALRDDEWLARTGDAPVPEWFPTAPPDPGLAAVATERVQSLLATPGGPSVAARALRLLAFEARIGVIVEPAATAASARLVDLVVVPALLDATAAEVLRAAATAPPPGVLRRVVSGVDEALAAAARVGAPPTPIHPAVLGWLLPFGPSDEAVRDLLGTTARDGYVDCLVGRYAVLAAGQLGGAPVSPSLRTLAMLIRREDDDAGGIGYDAELDRLRNQGLPAADMVAIESALPSLFTGQAFFEALATQPWSPAVAALTAHVLGRELGGNPFERSDPHADAALALAQLRADATGVAVLLSSSRPVGIAQRILGGLAVFRLQPLPVALPAELADAVTVAIHLVALTQPVASAPTAAVSSPAVPMLGAVTVTPAGPGSVPPQAPAVWRHATAVSPLARAETVVGALGEFVRRGILSPRTILIAALLGDPGVGARGPVVTADQRKLHELVTADGGCPLRALLRHLIATRLVTSPEPVEALVSDLTMRQLASALADDSLRQDILAAVRDQWREVAGDGDDPAGRRAWRKR